MDKRIWIKHQELLLNLVFEKASLERRNWLLHSHYVRGEYDSCRALISEILRDMEYCEFAHYVRGLLMRREGRVQESIKSFQQALLLNPSSIDNLRQLARSLYVS